eukprot:CAMPEP_0201281794 /NCGR_PEP_ID=MMETSP1317-20130820/4067_1 /ASSEMBLY_ACC=CAM_ASM_000770 /TAXON_ID=187299 /ORGANISM="Undescribed Undescribed, Strain Undescribed" /LENGTH=43 /DNA_ID= /DNA_START= /DNA_END= /DNA_ORIENTATION=
MDIEYKNSEKAKLLAAIEKLKKMKFNMGEGIQEAKKNTGKITN